jgi:hypothetical protein
MIGKSLFVSLLLTALIGTANAVPVTYYFSGALNDPFGNLVVGTLFNGSFSYDDSQPLNTPFVSYRGDYEYTNLSVTFGSTTVSDNGTGVINVYNNPGYPTDLFHLYTFSLAGALGGLTLAQGAGLQVVLQDLTGTVFNNPSIPSPNLAFADFTPGNATFLQLQELFSPDPSHQSVSARGELSFISSTSPVPEPASLSLMLSGLAILASFKCSSKRRNRK